MRVAHPPARVSRSSPRADSPGRGGASKVRLPGTHRADTLSATIERGWSVADRLGITRVADVTGLDAIGIPVVMVSRPLSRGLSVSQGKGVSLDAATASGLMESIELFHAEHIRQPVRLASRNELAETSSVVDIGLTRSHNTRFHAELRIPWILARPVTGGAPTWVPFEVVDLDFVLPRPYLTGCFQGSSNGLASGNTWAEAVVHALCEVIERDARTLWELGGAEARADTRVDLATVTDPVVRELLERFAAAGVAVGVWDITSDVGIPCFGAAVMDEGTGALRRLVPAAGYGCHLDPGVALCRALTEAAQARLTVIAGARDDLSRNTFLHGRDRSGLADLERQLAAPASVDYGTRPSQEAESFEGDIEVIVQALETSGLPQPLLVDLSRADIGIPVVKCVVPGLEGKRDPDYPSPLGPRGRARLEGRS